MATAQIPEGSSVCPLCRGAKEIRQVAGTASNMVTCPRCGGSGAWTVPKRLPGAVESVPPVDVPHKKPEPGGKKNLGDHPFLKAELYEPCPACRGTRVTKSAMMVDGLKVAGRAEPFTGAIPAGTHCPLCEGSDGYQKIGLTVGQLERIRAERDVLISALVRVSEYMKGVPLEITSSAGDSSVDVANAVENALEKCGEKVLAGRLALRRYLVDRSNGKDVKPPD